MPEGVAQIFNLLAPRVVRTPRRLQICDTADWLIALRHEFHGIARTGDERQSRLHAGADSVVPSGLDSHIVSSPNAEALGYFRASLRDGAAGTRRIGDPRFQI